MKKIIVTLGILLSTIGCASAATLTCYFPGHPNPIVRTGTFYRATNGVISFNNGIYPINNCFLE